MPELPEVETIRRRLHPDLVGRTVLDLRVLDQTVSLQSEDELRGMLAGRAVAGTARRGKWLIVDLGEVLMVVHLRMTGRLLWLPGEEERGRRPRFTIDLEGGRTLHFFDVRRFGRLWALPAARADEFFAGLGAEPLEDAFTVAHLRERLAGRRAPLKSFLTDQRRLAGVGNIYADEALFRARLHPLRPAGSVGPREARRLHAAVVETLRLGVEHEGSSVESFVDPAGSRGRFQQILNVYQRTDEPCRVCGTPIRRLVVGGRSTHFCPRCQPRHRMNVRPAGGGPPVGEGPRASGDPPRQTRAGRQSATEDHVSGRSADSA
jgi:formamidopyrimidine-DNA glycosylase